MLASARWSQFAGQSQSVAVALAALGHEVLYVDPPVSPLSVVRNPERLPDLVGSVSERPRPGLTVWRPRVLPGQNSRVGLRVNARVIARGVKANLGVPDITLAYSLESRATVRLLPGLRTYVCYDSFENVQGVDAERLLKRQRALLASVDRVVVTSLPLQRQMQRRGHRSAYVPHGCDAVFVTERAATVPLELEGRPRPFGGYLGTLNYRLDAGLLEAALDGLGNGTLVLIGASVQATGPGLNRRSRALLAHERVIAVGHREGSDLARLLSSLDVGLVPYSLTEFNRMSYPIKILQYLAAGLPVVSSTNGATEELRELVARADDAATFAHEVARSVGPRDHNLEVVRRATAAARPWSTVAQEILDAC